MSGEQREKELRKFIERMPSLSTTVTKVLEICNRPDTSPNDLNRVISLDPVLTGQVLKLINSAYYSLPNQIGSLTRAIIMLGINTVKNLALSTAVLGSLGREDSFHSLEMDAFWTHSLGVGVTAKALASRQGIAKRQREEYFVAGLLHDLGKIPLDTCLPGEYARVLQLAASGIPLERAEAEVLGLDHAQVGRMIGEKWQLNPGLIGLLAGHHRLDPAGAAGDPLTATIAIADTFVNLRQLGSAGNLYPDRQLSKELARQWGLRRRDLEALVPEVEEEIARAKVFLAVAREA